MDRDSQGRRILTSLNTDEDQVELNIVADNDEEVESNMEVKARYLDKQKKEEEPESKLLFITDAWVLVSVSVIAIIYIIYTIK